jgi:hypothetical protein
VINSGGTLFAAAINETGGTIRVDGTLDPDSFHIFATISGTGTVIGNVTNDGTVIMGDSVNAPGTLSETGDYIQNGDGTLDESIASGVLNSTLDVTGNVTLGGTLNVDLLSGFTPSLHEVFDVINFTGTEDGTFAGVTGSDQGDWTVLYENSSVDLEFTQPNNNNVPDAGTTWLLLGIGLAGLGLMAGLRRRAA